VPRDVVGVVVGLEDVLDRDPYVAGELEVPVDLELRVDDCGHAGVVVADQVGGAAEVIVGNLSEDHGGVTAIRSAAGDSGGGARQESHRGVCPAFGSRARGTERGAVQASRSFAP